jgi:hypothetical protein
MDALPSAGWAVLVFLVSTGGYLGFEVGDAVGAAGGLAGASVVGLVVGAAVMMLCVLRYYEGYARPPATPRYDCAEFSDTDLALITEAAEVEVTAEVNYTMVGGDEWRSRQQTRTASCPPAGKCTRLYPWVRGAVGWSGAGRQAVCVCVGGGPCALHSAVCSCCRPPSSPLLLALLAALRLWTACPASVKVCV